MGIAYYKHNNFSTSGTNITLAKSIPGCLVNCLHLKGKFSVSLQVKIDLQVHLFVAYIMRKLWMMIDDDVLADDAKSR